MEFHMRTRKVHTGYVNSPRVSDYLALRDVRRLIIDHVWIVWHCGRDDRARMCVLFGSPRCIQPMCPCGTVTLLRWSSKVAR